MAVDKKIALDLEVNIKKGDMTLGELNKQLQDLGDNIQEQKDILIEFEKELLDLDKIQANTSKTELARQAELKDKQDELKVAIKDQRLAIRDLTNEQSKASGEVNAYNKELENTKKGLDKTAEAQKKAATGSGIFAKGLQLVGSAIKKAGIGILISAGLALFDALRKNQKVLDLFSTALETVSIITGKIVSVFVNVTEQVYKSSKGFEGLRNVMSSLLTKVISPFQLKFYEIKAALQQVQLAWEKSFFGGKDVNKISELNKEIDGTKKSISGVMSDSAKASENLQKAASEIGGVVSGTIDGISKISLSGAYEQAKSNVAVKKSAEIAAAQQALLVEEYDRQAEKLRQVRDEERNSIEVRKKANDDLNKVLDAQEKAMLYQADLQIAAAKAEKTKNDNTETQIALIEAQGNRLAVLAQIEGFRSEQKVNDLGLDRERIELNKALSDSDAQLAYERKKFDAEQITNKLKSLEALRVIESEYQQQEMLRLETIIEATNRGTQAEADAIQALNEFREVSRQANISAERAILEETFALNEQRIADEATLAKNKKEQADKDAEQRKKDLEEARALEKAKYDIASSTLTALSNLANAFADGDEQRQKKAFKLNKAIGIGQSIISTAQAVTGALSEPSLIPGERFVKAGVAAAVGAAQIATIAKTQFNGGNNNITQPTLGGGGAGASPIGFTQNLNNTQIPTTKVIVTETDIRRATRNIDGIYNKAVVVE
tara:strand:- start:843 stop:3008 length:2166 start_codon:yes stop_codon:yes gene_type:complete